MTTTFYVEYTVRGAYTIKTRTFDTATEAAHFAARWRRSNSQGHYEARVYDSRGRLLAL